MSLGIWQILLLLIVVLLLFGGGGKISRMMGDLGKGVRSMREGLKGEEAEEEKDKKATRNLPHAGVPESEKQKDETHSS